MSNLILKAERGLPSQGMEGTVFRHPRYGPVEVIQVTNTPLANGRWEVAMWVTEAPTHKRAFLEECELGLSALLQLFENREAACA